MPLLVGRSSTPPNGGGGPGSPDDIRTYSGATWTSPSGTSIDLMAFEGTEGAVILHDGVSGLGASPRVVTRTGLAGGGSLARWSHAAERVITLPVLLYAQSTEALHQLRRRFTRAFTETTPPAGVPRTGTLRLTRPDSSWREVSAIYEEGLTWEDTGAYGIYEDVVVLTLVCPDPWWYGSEQPALEWRPTITRDYLSPYETVSPSVTLGEQDIEVLGDAPVDPVWTLGGPMTSATAGTVGGPEWTFGDVLSTETITIDISATPPTITDQNGTNRIGDLVWPESTLWSLPNGETTINVNLTGGQTAPIPSYIRMTYRPRWETA